MIHGNDRQRQINAFEHVECPKPADYFQRRRFDESSQQKYQVSADDLDTEYFRPPASVLDAVEITQALNEENKQKQK